jgi:hypothetical protein
MAREELGIRTDYDIGAFTEPLKPIDEDPKAMRELFEYMRRTVVADLDAYSSGAYDAENDSEAAQALEMTQLASRNKYDAQVAREMVNPAGIPNKEVTLMRRAYDTIEAIELMDLSPYQAEDPEEAWERALNVAATERMRRELGGIRAGQHLRSMGRAALRVRFDTGQ